MALFTHTIHRQEDGQESGHGGKRKAGRFSPRFLGGALLAGSLALSFFTVAPTVFGVVGNQNVPVVDEANIQVNSESVRALEELVGLLSELVEKEVRRDPEDEGEAKAALVEKNKETLTDIQKGFSGYLDNRYLSDCNGPTQSPYAEDQPDLYFQEVAESEFNRFMEKSYGFSVCGSAGSSDTGPEPYSDAVAEGLRRSNPSFDSTYYDRNYTFDDVTGSAQNSEAFYGGDFSQGGWNSWFAMTQVPDNNPYGAFDKAQEALNRRTAAALETERLKLDWNQGYHGNVEVIENPDTGEIVGQRTITPGNINREKLSRAVGFCDDALTQIGEHGSSVGAESVVADLVAACDQIEEDMKTGGVLEEDFLDTFDSFINDLFDINLQEYFDNMVDMLEDAAMDVAKNIINSIIANFF
ncbi:MAG: hypothetical protein WD049_10385 [Candidatus Paceibacterota bacterium]